MIKHSIINITFIANFNDILFNISSVYGSCTVGKRGSLQRYDNCNGTIDWKALNENTKGINDYIINGIKAETL